MTPTGITAYNLRKDILAMTLVRFANIEYAAENLEKFKKAFCFVKEKWMELDFIIIKEISIFLADLLDWMDHYI